MKYNPRYIYDANGRRVGKVETAEDQQAGNIEMLLLAFGLTLIAPLLVTVYATYHYLKGVGAHSFIASGISLAAAYCLVWLCKRFWVIKALYLLSVSAVLTAILVWIAHSASQGDPIWTWGIGLTSFGALSWLFLAKTSLVAQPFAEGWAMKLYERL